VAKAQESEAEKSLADVNPDELTPREALELLYSLRRLMRSR
jgi:DNA mismatch repair protein MutS